MEQQLPLIISMLANAVTIFLLYRSMQKSSESKDKITIEAMAHIKAGSVMEVVESTAHRRYHEAQEYPQAAAVMEELENSTEPVDNEPQQKILRTPDGKEFEILQGADVIGI